MSFEKVIPSKIEEYKIFDATTTDELIKVASDIDFPEGFVYDPDFLYMWVRIVSSGEAYGPNKNGDYFPEAELIAYWETFKEAHPFKNHENKNVENAIGKIIQVRWNPIMKCVEILKAIDKKAAPEVVRGYLKGYLSDVSMGCKVPYTVCSVCGNKARRRSEFCDHVRFHRLQFLPNGERVFEINYKPKFHDSSTVLNGAERVAKAFFIFSDSSPGDALISSFRKAASAEGSTHYIRYTEEEMMKIAAANEELHPLLKDENLEKHATATPMIKKIAELEKELTGKLLDIVSKPNKAKLPKAKQMLEVIKFLTEKRLDEASLKNIAASVKAAANENGVPVAKAFSTLIGVAELLGIEFFPKELHTLLCELTDAKLNNELGLSVGGMDNVFPSDYTKGVQHAVVQIESARDFHSPACLLKAYDESAHNVGGFMDNPFHFLSNFADGNEMNDRPPVRMIQIIKKTLNPMIAMRSFHPQHLYPRLAVVLGGHRPIIGGEDVRQDMDVLTSPSTPGDVLARLAYGLYERMRPNLMGTRLIKVASEYLDGMNKTASEVTPNIGWLGERRQRLGLSVPKLALGALPLAYGASAFEKSRRENGNYLSDGENFVADHPGYVAGGLILAGRPVSKGLHFAAKKGTEAVNAGKEAVKNGVDNIKDKFTYRSVWDDLEKGSGQTFEGMVKEAETLSSGSFNVFNDNEVLKRYMSQTGASGAQASAVKMATLLTMGGMDKEAYEIMSHYNIPSHEKGRFLKIAASYFDEEMEKAAEEFTNNLLLSAIGDHSPLAPTLPGRALDAFLFKKLTQMTQPKPTVPAPVEPMKGE